MSLSCTDKCSQTGDCKYGLTFQATGCPNMNPNAGGWKTRSDNTVFNNMFTDCTVVMDGSASAKQISWCCGEGNECRPTSCNKQTTWTTGINTDVP